MQIGFAAKFLVICIKIYRVLFSIKRPCCRFIPSCSTYAIEAISKYGAIKGFWLTVKRVLRCRPGFSKLKNCGFDPVP
ncbi:MAG: membrane protein insertion efficiency factor YidD [Holosporales bacterium]|jgi:putative membrane protein insertion efficiency factor|nr:membrane protein insertion efficiency factor YidD [Holosporales bacterium]